MGKESGFMSPGKRLKLLAAKVNKYLKMTKQTLKKIIGPGRLFGKTLEMLSMFHSRVPAIG